MNFFDELIIPPTENHVLVLKYMLLLSLMLFVPYLGMVMGGSYLSVRYGKKSVKTGNKMYARFAKEVLEKLTIVKNAEIALGIIPVISITCGYAQLLYEAQTITVSMFALAALLIIIALIMIYRYRMAFRISTVLNSVTSSGTNETVEEFESDLRDSARRSGQVGLWTLVSGAYMFAGAAALAANSHKWANVGNLLQVIFSWATFFNFLYMLAAAGAITGAAILFYFFKWNGGVKDMDENYSGFVRNLGAGIGFASVASMPVLLFINYLYLPGESMSQASFVYIILFLIAAIIVGNLLYSTVKNSDIKLATPIFLTVFILLTIGILKDQSVFGGAIQEQTLEIIEKSEEHEKEIQKKLVLKTGIDPQAIFNQKCIACHKMDQKVIGPPYKETVPKYNGNVSALAEFIYNPVKKDPNYPVMPNQGLKKKEATAMAKWLMEQVGK